MESSPTLLNNIERHCNNYFNPQNDPNSPIRNYPDEFLELVERIAEYIEKTKKQRNVVSASFGVQSYTYDVERGSWQVFFKHDLSVWKRAKFL